MPYSSTANDREKKRSFDGSRFEAQQDSSSTRLGLECKVNVAPGLLKKFCYGSVASDASMA